MTASVLVDVLCVRQGVNKNLESIGSGWIVYCRLAVGGLEVIGGGLDNKGQDHIEDLVDDFCGIKSESWRDDIVGSSN